MYMLNESKHVNSYSPPVLQPSVCSGKRALDLLTSSVDASSGMCLASSFLTR